MYLDWNWITSMLPLFLGGIAASEALLYTLERKGIKLQLVLAVILSIIFAIISFILSDSRRAENTPIFFLIVSMLLPLLPLLLFSIANIKIAKIKILTLKHFLLILLVFVTYAKFQLYALLLVCFTGSTVFNYESY